MSTEHRTTSESRFRHRIWRVGISVLTTGALYFLSFCIFRCLAYSPVSFDPEQKGLVIFSLDPDLQDSALTFYGPLILCCPGHNWYPEGYVIERMIELKQMFDESEPFPDERVTAIAGEYFFGDGLGVNCSLSLKSNSSFTFNWSGCLGAYDENEGTFDFDDRLLVMTPTEPNVRDGFRGMATNFIPVRWESRQYLIPDDEALEFCNAVNQGLEPRDGHYGSFFLREGECDHSVKGLPDLPDSWQKFLLPAPVRGAVIEQLDKQHAVIDIGAEDGILVGMVLIARGPPGGGFNQLRVTSVESGQSKVTPKSEYDFVIVGQSVSSLLIESGRED